MSWNIFVCTVLPLGAFLVTMLASGKQVPMWAASKVLSTPLTFHHLQYSLGAVMTALCLALSYLSFLSLRRCEARVSEASGEPQLQDQRWRDVFHQGRNLYLSLLGLTLWSLAWRLKVLHDSDYFHAPCREARRRSSALARGLFLALGLAALLLADIPLCRLNYTLYLETMVTPTKTKLIKVSQPCEGIMRATAGGQCAEFCQGVRQLSEERNRAILFARNWHVLGRWAAEVFDSSRGMEQGEGRIEALFDRKSCAEILRSVDKSNQMVNCLCVTLAGFSLIGAFTCFAHALHERHAHEE